MIEGIIYKFTNKINGKIYIGQTIDEERRYSEHKCAHKDCHFHNAINKYGIENFSYEVIFRDQFNNIEDAKFVLGDRERQAILDYQSFDNRFGYNCTFGGDGGPIMCGEDNPFYGKHHSQETKDKISKANKGKLVGRKNGFYDKHHSEETKIKISNYLSRKFEGAGNPNFHNGNIFEYNNQIYSTIELSKLINCSSTCIYNHIKCGQDEFKIKGHKIKLITNGNI